MTAPHPLTDTLFPCPSCNTRHRVLADGRVVAHQARLRSGSTAWCGGAIALLPSPRPPS